MLLRRALCEIRTQEHFNLILGLRKKTARLARFDHVTAGDATRAGRSSARGCHRARCEHGARTSTSVRAGGRRRPASDSSKR